MTDQKICGIIMPISGSADYSAAHWADVLNILSETVVEAGLKPNMVSNSEEVTVIQKTILSNLFENDLIVCDVSSKNPNVMLELGLRLAFDKPAVIVKDEITDYSFDTSPLRHLSYPKDLRFYDVLRFKNELKNTLQATVSGTHEASFLKAFGTFKVARLDTQEVSQEELILDEIRSLRRSLNARASDAVTRPNLSFEDISYELDQEITSDELMKLIAHTNVAMNLFGASVIGSRSSHGRATIIIRKPFDTNSRLVLNIVDDYFSTTRALRGKKRAAKEDGE